MIPTMIEDLISKVTDKKVHTDKRQFYYATLVKIKEAISVAIVKYENEKHFK